MVVQVLEWSLSGDDSLNEESEHGEHSKTSVLDLLDLELSEGVWVISKTQWVEWTSWVESVETLSPVEGTSWGVTEGLSLSHEDHLASNSGNNGLSMDQVGVSEVVKSVIREDGSSGLEPNSSISELSGSVGLEKLWGDASKGSQHSPAGVDKLKLTVLGESLWISRESSSIPSVISWEFSVQVAWDGTLREWTEEEWALWSVPLGVRRLGSWLSLQTNNIHQSMLCKMNSVESVLSLQQTVNGTGSQYSDITR